VTPATRQAVQPAGGTRLPREHPEPLGRPVGEFRGAPVIVLAPAFGGGIALGSLLGRHPGLASTSGSGLLPLCDQAMATWRSVEGRADRPPSQLAVTATRVLATSVITAVLARAGKRRWCEVAAASPQAAETFLGLFPGTRFLCLHRACPGLIRAALDASPWGTAHPAFVPYTRAYPVSAAAALTAYWVEHARNLLAFERAHPQECLRLRFEDLTGARHQTAERIEAFLGLDPLIHGLAMPDDDSQQPPSAGPRQEANLPVDLIPPNLLAQANELLRQLDYPALPE
jgi:protein-tyrosine sulfotransferase